MIEKHTVIAPEDLLRLVAGETQYLMDILLENPEDQYEIVQLYQDGILLIGRAWDLDDEAAAARKDLRRTAPEEDEDDIWMQAEDQILDILWGLFNTAVRLNRPEDRQTICDLTREIMDFHGLDLRVKSI